MLSKCFSIQTKKIFFKNIESTILWLVQKKKAFGELMNDNLQHFSNQLKKHQTTRFSQKSRNESNEKRSHKITTARNSVPHRCLSFPFLCRRSFSFPFGKYFTPRIELG